MNRFACMLFDLLSGLVHSLSYTIQATVSTSKKKPSLLADYGFGVLICKILSGFITQMLFLYHRFRKFYKYHHNSLLMLEYKPQD